MEQFSAAELAELYYLSISAMEAHFQYWLTITFAAVVAGFVGARYAGIRLRRLAATLYVVTSVFFIFRYYSSAYGFLQWQSALQERDVILDGPIGSYLSVPRLVVWLTGTLIAAYILARKFAPADDRL